MTKEFIKPYFIESFHAFTLKRYNYLLIKRSFKLRTYRYAKKIIFKLKKYAKSKVPNNY